MNDNQTMGKCPSEDVRVCTRVHVSLLSRNPGHNPDLLMTSPFRVQSGRIHG